ncbi:MAG TPA: MBL fold metallo-hydrolase [Saprospiraceae bacterium]|nr:MBL fold metallo-hydrolase [Saprospiraceae bacterium]
MKFIISLLLGCFFLSANVSAQKTDYPDFTIQKLSDGVYAAIAKNGGHAICNAGIVDLGDATLIFDPFMSVQAATDLKAAAEQLTLHPVKYVVNSHYHNDHIGGNQVFEGASIISTYRTRDLIAENQPAEIEWGETKGAERLKKYTDVDVSKLSGHALEEHIMWTGYYETYVISNGVLKVVLPNVTMDDELNIYGSKRRVQLISHGAGHTESDLYLYLPDEQIVFAGDLLFINNQPWIVDGDTEKWEATLTKITSLAVKNIVPGHGPVGTLADIEKMEDYFHNVQETAQGYYNKGISPEEAEDLTSPAPYDAWYLSMFYKLNVMAAYKRMVKK